ncbi:Uncharacterised protein [uncultured archaeon]|nr:Uncharacterised protein [uncultured archaeon]
MQQFLIPARRAKLLEDRKVLEPLCERLGCSIAVQNGNEVVITGEPYEEYNARNVVQAFARGFELNTAYKLLSDDYFFKSTDMRDMFRNEDRIKRIKARIIGKEGRSKSYMQSVSGAELSVYGDTVSMIGTVDEIKIMSAAVDVLLEGGTHKKAYFLMEKTKKGIRRG